MGGRWGDMVKLDLIGTYWLGLPVMTAISQLLSFTLSYIPTDVLKSQSAVLCSSYMRGVSGGSRSDGGLQESSPWCVPLFRDNCGSSLAQQLSLTQGIAGIYAGDRARRLNHFSMLQADTYVSTSV